jgi:hypothetical protein
MTALLLALALKGRFVSGDDACDADEARDMAAIDDEGEA